MKNGTQGFTLIELLIVIAIIGILAAVLIPNLLGAQKRAYDTGAASCAKSIQTAQATAQVDNQGYFAIAKAAGTADAAPDITAGSLPAVPAYADLGIAENCKSKDMVIATTTAPSNTSATTRANYVITVKDVRGSKTYTITPNSQTSATNS